MQATKDDRQAPGSRRDEPLSILMVVSEAVPFAKTGGLADVGGALPLALGRLGHHVTVVMPRYRGVEAQGGPVTRFHVPLGELGCDAAFFERPLSDRCRLVFVDAPELYDREGLYGVGIHDYPDNPARYGFLTRAALEFVRRAGERPSVAHVHDWQGGLLPVDLRTRFADDPVLGGVPSVFTIHNLAYQGLFGPEWLPRLGFAWELFRPDRLEYWGKASYLKGGITFADMITTVSRKYAREILTPEYGFGFEGILQERRHVLTGILNGIDVEAWNPATDPLIPEPYDTEHLERKLASKRALLTEFRLSADTTALDRPLIGMISRLVAQKGFDLLSKVAHDLPGLGAAFVLLGTGDPVYQDLWTDLSRRHPEVISVKIGFDERLAHLIEAGADMFLMPSRFEPCGLNQMYSQRYGTVPIVRATGGLDDTVENYSERTGAGTGFKFKEYDGEVLLRTLKRAIRTFSRKKDWRALQVAGMRRDHSWDASAREYVKVYRKAMRTARPPRVPTVT